MVKEWSRNVENFLTMSGEDLLRPVDQNIGEGFACSREILSF
jgi:hypothetical protein